VQNNHVLEASLGYFINPLFTVVLGFVFLRERLRPLQIAAVCLASLGVINLVLALGVVPWIALALALSFGTYGLLRKIAPIEGMVGLSVETMLMFPVALGYLVYVGIDGEGAFLHASWRLDALIAAAGLVTALPLLWFTNAAKRLDYSTLGIVQYLAPSCQLLLAVFVYGEAFTLVHMVTFGCIWTALVIYTTDTTVALRRRSSILVDSSMRVR
jgi:chloramphenicol-sensitive protein RarD